MSNRNTSGDLICVSYSIISRFFDQIKEIPYPIFIFGHHPEIALTKDPLVAERTMKTHYEALINELQKNNLLVIGFSLCPHASRTYVSNLGLSNNSSYVQTCNCAPPKGGMLTQFKQSHVFVITDKLVEMQMALNEGFFPIFIPQLDEWEETKARDLNSSRKAIAADFADALAIMKQI